MPGLAAYRRRWGGRVWSWFSCPVLSSNAVALYSICGASGRKGGISKRLRAKADRGYHWQGARISPEDGGGREGQVCWRRMPPGVCWLRAAIKNLGFLLSRRCCACALLWSSAKRLSAASKRANQRRPARRVPRTSSSHHSKFEAENPRPEGVPQDHLGEVLCSCDC